MPLANRVHYLEHQSPNPASALPSRCNLTQEQLMESRPTVTVLIPTFNRADFLAECIDSILGQSLPPSQVVVVDDGSTDRTPEILADYGDNLTVLQGPNSGKPAALNVGLEKVTGSYLWIFDDDDVALPDALERFVAPLEAHPEHGFSYSTFYYTTTEADSNRIGDIFSQSRIPAVDEKGFLVSLLEANFLGGAALFARSTCYDRVGGFDEGLLRSQDYEMAIRIAQKFTGVRVEGTPTFHYRQHEGQRGPLLDRFGVSQRHAKWLEYDQIIFRRLYAELPLADYLPPGGDIEVMEAHARLQRLQVVASKLLVEESCRELVSLAELNPKAPKPEERRLIRRLNSTSYYGVGRMLDNQEFRPLFNELAQQSAFIRKMRAEIRLARLAALRRRALGVIRRAINAIATGSQRIRRAISSAKRGA